MKVVKITALWCSGCLIMNKVWNKVLEQESIETINLDIDMDEEEALKYNPGSILPVFIFYKDDSEKQRVIGEKSFDEMMEIVRSLGD